MAPRIASLVPAGTDMVAALGLAGHLVGVSHACDHPAARGKPVLTSTALPAAGVTGRPAAEPGQVDRAVTAAVQAGEPLYRTDMRLLERLQPDIVVSQGVCDVCAVTGDDIGALPTGAELVVLEATTLAGLESDLRRVGQATGREEEAGRWAHRLRRARGAVEALTAHRPRRRTLVLEWGDPPFVAGHWVPELVSAAGGEPLLCRPGRPSARTTWEEVGQAGAEVVVFAPCGYRLQTAATEARGLRRLPGEPELWATDATALFSRCTPASTVGALWTLAGILHSDIAPAPPRGMARRVA